MTKQFDVFLSYNSRDIGEVRELARRLGRSKVAVWLEEQQGVPGRRWGAELERMISEVDCAAVLFGKAGVGPWQDMEMRVCINEFASRGMPVIPVLMPSAPRRPALPLFLRQFTWADLRDGMGGAGFDRLLEAIPERSLQGRPPSAKAPSLLISSCRQDTAHAKRLKERLQALTLDPLPRFESWNERMSADSARLNKALGEAAIVVCLLSRKYAEVYGKSDWTKPLRPYVEDQGLVGLGLVVDEQFDPQQLPWWDVDAWPVLPRWAGAAEPEALDRGFNEVAQEIEQALTRQFYRPSPYPPPPAKKVQLKSLPVTELELCGRDSELRDLDKYWDDHKVRFVQLLGAGGSGKSTLINHWLEKLKQENYRGAENIFGWSFYSQAATPSVASFGGSGMASSDPFIHEAFQFFGNSGRFRASLWDRGKWLADSITEAAAKQRKRWNARCKKWSWLSEVPRRHSLLILDGLESLQYREGDNKGHIRDVALATFLTRLAEEGDGSCLCLITTRQKLNYKEGFDQYVKTIDLEQPLETEPACELLRLGGIQAAQKDLQSLAEKCGRYPLPLTLTAAYLTKSKTGRGDKVARSLKLVDATDKASLEDYVYGILKLFTEVLDSHQLQVLRMLALFKRPADYQAVQALRKADIRGLTDRLTLGEADDPSWTEQIESLWQQRLLTITDTAATAESEKWNPKRALLELHSVTGSYFANQLLETDEEAWKSGHRALFDHFLEQADIAAHKRKRRKVSKSPRDDKPDEKQLTYLFRAVLHGCLAEEYQRAWNLFWKQIRRCAEHYSGNGLGWWGLDQSTLSYFFDRQWDKPSVKLGSYERILVLNEAGYDLRALGMLSEALRPIQRSLTEMERYLEVPEHEQPGDGERKGHSIGEFLQLAAWAAGNLCKTYLAIGSVSKALTYSRQSVAYADQFARQLVANPDQAEDARELQAGSRTWLGDALRCRGQFWESEAAFRAAEELQPKTRGSSKSHFIKGTANYRFCELLLDQAEMVGEGLVERSSRCLSPWQDEESDPVVHRILEVRERTRQLLNENGEHGKRDLDACVYHLTLARALLLEADYRSRLSKEPNRGRREGSKAHRCLKDAEKHLPQAVGGLRMQAHQTYLARGLLVEAAYHRLTAVLQCAKNDPYQKALNCLGEVLEIATRGGMQLFEVEYHLELAKLNWTRHQNTATAGCKKQALLNLADAKAMVRELGYSRRALEISALQSAVREAR